MTTNATLYCTSLLKIKTKTKRILQIYENDIPFEHGWHGFDFIVQYIEAILIYLSY